MLYEGWPVGKRSRASQKDLNNLKIKKEGWIAEGLLASLFIGLVLFIILFSWISSSAAFGSSLSAGYVVISSCILLIMLATYRFIAFYRRRRFQNGGYDPLLLRKFMGSCLTKDCGEIKRYLSNSADSDVVFFNRMLLCKLQSILDQENQHLQDIRHRFRESRIKRISRIKLECYFKKREDYDQEVLPDELRHVIKTLKPLATQFEDLISRLLMCRRNLFTVMSDYSDLLAVSEKEIEKLRETYRYNPPRNDVAGKIVFASKVIDYMNNLKEGKLPDDQQMAMQKLASRKMLQLKSVASEYRRAWRDLVTAYENYS